MVTAVSDFAADIEAAEAQSAPTPATRTPLLVIMTIALFEMGGWVAAPVQDRLYKPRQLHLIKPPDDEAMTCIVPKRGTSAGPAKTSDPRELNGDLADHQ
jgi:hypothetical protein